MGSGSIIHPKLIFRKKYLQRVSKIPYRCRFNLSGAKARHLIASVLARLKPFPDTKQAFSQPV